MYSERFVENSRWKVEFLPRILAKIVRQRLTHILLEYPYGQEGLALLDLSYCPLFCGIARGGDKPATLRETDAPSFDSVRIWSTLRRIMRP
jgi:hypothetical protein